MTTHEAAMQHDELQLAADRLRLAAGPAGNPIPASRMRALLERELGEFGCCLAESFAIREAEDVRLETERPGLTAAIDNLRERRTALCLEAETLLARLAGECDVRALGAAILDMLKRLDQLQTAEEALALSQVLDDRGLGNPEAP